MIYSEPKALEKTYLENHEQCVSVLVLPGVPIFHLELLIGFKVLQTLPAGSAPLHYCVTSASGLDESDPPLYQTGHFSILCLQGFLIPVKTSICNFSQAAALPQTSLTVYRFALITPS